jgi:DNA-binding CsgD family transcriptional regulator
VKEQAANGMPINRGGQPAFVPTPNQRETVKVMVAAGIQQLHIAVLLGISRPTLRKHFRHEIDLGTAQITPVVLAAHLKLIEAGDMRAIEWWEKARMGWTENVIVDDGRADRPMRVIVELVG